MKKESNTGRILGIILLTITVPVGILIVVYNYLFKDKMPKTTTAASTSVAGSTTTPSLDYLAPKSVSNSTTVSSYVTISNLPTIYKRLLSTGTTAHTIPAGTLEYSWEIVSGEAVVNGETLPAGYSETQEYTTGVSYAAIVITGVTGEVKLSYKKPA